MWTIISCVREYLFDISTESSIDGLLVSTVARLREMEESNIRIITCMNISQAYIFSHFPARDFPQISSEVPLH